MKDEKDVNLKLKWGLVRKTQKIIILTEALNIFVEIILLLICFAFYFPFAVSIHIPVFNLFRFYVNQPGSLNK